MKTLNITWKGISPLIMHSCKCVNPLHPISIKMKEFTSKRKKTEDDLIQLADLEWESGAYWDDNIGLFIPVENIEATIKNGAKQNRKGADITKYVDVIGCKENILKVPLNYYNNFTKEELIQRYEYRDTRVMTVPATKSKVLRTRPRFNNWEISFQLRYNENKIELKTIVDAIEYAGSFVGLCDSRPKYGRFQAIVEEVD